jgi:hypothetical protein
MRDRGGRAVVRREASLGRGLASLSSLLLLPTLLPLLLSFFCACYGFLPQPVRVDRVRAATEAEKKRCDSQQADPRIYGPGLVSSVSPLYYYVQTGGGREARLHGAELRLRPLPGMTPELVTTVLSCRSARLVLGRVEGAANEPYWLPDGWVKIDTRSEDGSFVVTLDGEDLPEAKEILARASAFAAPAGP